MYALGTTPGGGGCSEYMLVTLAHQKLGVLGAGTEQMGGGVGTGPAQKGVLSKKKGGAKNIA